MTITREMIQALADHPEGMSTTELALIWQKRRPHAEHWEALHRVSLAMRIHARKGNVAKAGSRPSGGHPVSLWQITQQGREQYLNRREEVRSCTQATVAP